MINVISVPHIKQADTKKLINYYQRILDDEDKADLTTVKRERELLLKKLKGKVL